MATNKKPVKSGKSRKPGKTPKLGMQPSRRKRKAPAESLAAKIPETTDESNKEANRRYVRSLIAQGQAVPAGQPLPPGATHEIIGQDEDGSPIVRRKRFSLK